MCPKEMIGTIELMNLDYKNKKATVGRFL